MSDQSVLLPKWFSHGGITLAKQKLRHPYSFWTMTILIFSPVANFGQQSLPTWFFSVLTFTVFHVSTYYVSVHYFFFCIHITLDMKYTPRSLGNLNTRAVLLLQLGTQQFSSRGFAFILTHKNTWKNKREVRRPRQGGAAHMWHS